ncbi:putative hormone-sensitive lipase, partial [Operophtera brumata]
MSFTESPAKASLCCEESLEGAPSTYAMYEALKDSCQNNATYFQPDDSENGQRLYQGFMTLMDHIDTVWPLVDHVRKVAPLYDFDSKSPGNGYRSFVSVVDSCVLHGLKLSRQVCTGRDALLFRKGHFVKEIESCGQLLASLATCLHHHHTLLSWAPTGELFPTENHTPEELFSQADTINQYCFYGRCLGFQVSITGHLPTPPHTLLSWAPTGELFPTENHTPEELFSQADTINQYCFYGRCLGFQFLPSMRGILKGISICMAGFSEAYYCHGNLISSMWTGGQYLIDPEMRARRIVNISQSASIEFCKALMSTTVAVNRIITIPPEPLTVTSNAGEDTKGSEGSSSLPPADGVLFHCHGGGFVAQSSKSHETYLREWAAKLNVPILSVDYSLAPQAPFPRALDEVLYAVPDGMFLAYAPLNVSFVPSPARLLCLMDPILPFGFMMRCLKAYASPGKGNNQKGKAGDKKDASNAVSNPTTPLDSNGFLKEVSPSDLAELQAHKSGSERRKSSDTTISAASLQSEHTATGIHHQHPFEECLRRTWRSSRLTSRAASGGSLPTPPSAPPRCRASTLPQVFIISILSRSVSVGPGGAPGSQVGQRAADHHQRRLAVERAHCHRYSSSASFRGVSPSDLAELQAHKSGSERRITISAASLQSEHTATGVTPPEDKSQQMVSDFLE